VLGGLPLLAVWLPPSLSLANPNDISLRGLGRPESNSVNDPAVKRYRNLSTELAAALGVTDPEAVARLLDLVSRHRVAVRIGNVRLVHNGGNEPVLEIDLQDRDDVLEFDLLSQSFPRLACGAHLGRVRRPTLARRFVTVLPRWAWTVLRLVDQLVEIFVLFSQQEAKAFEELPDSVHLSLRSCQSCRRGGCHGEAASLSIALPAAVPTGAIEGGIESSEEYLSSTFTWEGGLHSSGELGDRAERHQ